MKTQNTLHRGAQTAVNRFTSNLIFTSYVLFALLALLVLAPLSKAQEDVIPVETSTVAAADITPPSDVENVKAAGGDGEITLSWNVATDDVGIKGYKIYYGTKPVGQDGQKYESGPVDAGNKISYAVTNLTNGTAYYFAVTAYDEAGNESDNYSVEVSATPAHAAADAEAPKVVSATAVDKQSVKVLFSEAVVLPTTSAESAFTIKNDATQVALQVTGAKVDTNDTSKKTVVLTTEAQEGGASYILTAGIQVKDAAGNPIVSGTSDTAVFTGSNVETLVATQQTQAQADTTGPEMVDVKAPDSTHVVITFSEPVKLAADPTQNFIITEEENIENTLVILLAALGTDGTTVTLTTDPQKAIKYNLIVVDVADNAGNLISVDNNATVFTGATGGTVQPTPPTQQTGGDASAPEDATNFMAKIISSMMVTLSWTGSLNTAGDLANYILYKSTDGTTYGDGVILNPDATSFDVSSLAPGMKYFFKLTTKDKSGNESKGVVTTFTLPGTGPEILLFAVGSLGLGKFYQRKKRNKR